MKHNGLAVRQDSPAVAFRNPGSWLVRSISLANGTHDSIIDPVPPILESHEDWDRLVLQGKQPESTVPSNPFNLRYVDLFAGCGGLSLGIEQAANALGGTARSALAVDIDPKVLEIYAHNFRCERVLAGDISEVTKPSPTKLGQIDLLVGGPPCQGHSNLNNHTRRSDDRNRLYFEMIKFALDYDVPVVIIENVPTVMRSRVEVVEQSAAVLRFGGYHIESLSINGLDIGIPQTRKRHVLLASKIGLPSIRDFIDAFRTPPRTVGSAIEDLLDIEPHRRVDIPANLAEVNRHRIRELFRLGLYDMPMHLRPPSHQFGQYSYTAVYGRLRWDQPAGTITTNFRTPGCGRFIHPLRQRTLTMHEAARLQTFPDTFEFFPPGVELSNHTVQTAIGNAVPPKLGFVLGLWALTALGLPKPKETKHSDNGHSSNGNVDQSIALQPIEWVIA